MRKKLQKKTTVTLLSGSVLLAAATGAQALEVKTGNDKVGLELYGRISRAMMFVDDGNENKVFHVDNTHSESLIGIKATTEASEAVDIGGKFEVQWQANPSDKVSMEEESISGEFEERIMEVYFDVNKLGQFSIGRGDMSSNNSSEVDLSGTSIAGNVGIGDGGGGFVFYDATAAMATDGEEGEDTGITVGNVFDQMDGLSRKNRVRYDTPTVAGFSLGISAGEKEMADATLVYSGEIGGTKLEGAVAYCDPGEGKDYTQINGSVSVLFPFGLNFTVAGGSRDVDDMPADGDDPTFMYGKIGYKFDKLFQVGSTAISFDYGVFENIEQQNTEEEGTAYGVQLVQKLSDWNTELFAAYRSVELEDNTGADYEPISLAMTGVRIKF